MRKILVIAGILLCIFFAALYAQPARQQKPSGGGYEEEVLKKLDQILQNQADQLDYLKFIKNRAR